MRKHSTTLVCIVFVMLLIILVLFVISVQNNRRNYQIKQYKIEQSTQTEQSEEQYSKGSGTMEAADAGNSIKEYHTIKTDALSYPLEYPMLREGDTLIEHPGFTLVYSETHEQAAWVAYQLTSNELAGSVSRSDKFMPDPMVKTGSAVTNDYRNSGYDRGHLAPAADMKWSYASMNASFYYSNISPQHPGFNRGIWKQAEEQVREWAKRYGALYVVNGPVLCDSLPSIGDNRVSIPEYYFKVVIDTALRRPAALLIPHKSSKQPLRSFMVSIDSIESLTGFDFFYQLNDSFENQLEKTIEPEKWAWE